MIREVRFAPIPPVRRVVYETVAPRARGPWSNALSMLDSKYWEDIGNSSPYWGVLSHERFQGRELDDDRHREFFAAGRSEIDEIVSQIRRLYPEFTPRRALDFGCGVGRLVIPMRSFAEAVVGVDVSQTMLAVAEREVLDAGLTGVTFASVVPEGPFDWLNSYIVFQHIQPETGYQILASLLEKAGRPAVVSLHLTTYRDKRVLFRGIQESASGRYDGQTYVSFERAGLVDMPIYEYDLSRVTFMLNRAGFESLLMNHTDHGGLHGAFIFGVRP